MITFEEALGQRRAFNRMVAACTVKSVKIEMYSRWVEWRNATEQLRNLGEMADTWAIALFCELIPGQLVLHESEAADYAKIVRKMERDGQATLHLEAGGKPYPIYVNYVGPTSPVIVLDVKIEPGDHIPEATADPEAGEEGAENQ